MKKAYIKAIPSLVLFYSRKVTCSKNCKIIFYHRKNSKRTKIETSKLYISLDSNFLILFPGSKSLLVVSVFFQTLFNAYWFVVSPTDVKSHHTYNF